MTTSEPLPAQAEVVVIGAGAVGLSVAAHLTERGVGGVVVLETDRLGSGSSAKPIGGFRAQFSDPVNAAMSQRSIKGTFLRFEERYGVDIGIDLCGYLFLCRTPQEVEDWETATAAQRDLGIDVRMLSASEVLALNPYLDPDAVLAGQFGLPAGNAFPDRIVEGYANGARRGGARIVEHCEVTGIDAVGDRAHVTTTRGAIASPVVIVATGAWSAGVGRMLGHDLPVRPVRRQIGFHRPALPPARIPFTLDVTTACFLHTMGPDVLVLGHSDPRQLDGFGRDYDDSWLPGLRTGLSQFASSAAELDVHDGWAGLYEMTPDANALIGELPGLPFRALYATGFSGHGVMHSPATGEVVADLVLGTTPFVDVRGFALERFAAGGGHANERIQV